MGSSYPEIDVIKDIHDENPGLVQNCAEESESKPQAMMANVRNGELLASITDCAVRPPLQERRGMSEANHSLSKCGDIRR